MTASIILVGLFAFILAITVLLNLLSPKIDPREPPVVNPTIPFVGHIIGMLREGSTYFRRLSEKNRKPIFTLPMLNGKMYIVASPSLAMSVQRAAATLDFDQLIANITPRLCGCNADTIKILQDREGEQEGRKNIVRASHSVINPGFGLPKIPEISAKQFEHFNHRLNEIQDGQEVDLYVFIRRNIMAASMNTFYGPNNPLAANPELLDRYWDWDDGIVEYLLGVMPQIIARKAYYGVEAVVKGFIEYTKQGLHREAIQMLQDRKKMHDEYGIAPEEHARLELGMALGINSNASITTFWVTNDIFSRPELLEEIRQEVLTNAVVNPGVISGVKLRDACPLLNSLIRETLRLIAPMTSARIVLEDTLLADTYLLKKNNIVQIAGSILHADTDIWGPDAASFNPRRFMHSPSGSKTNADGTVPDDKASMVHSAAFRAFGGGSSLCPGRHFAQMEILGFVAMLVTCFDLAPATGLDKVQWDPPRTDKKFPIVVIKPTSEVRVKLQRRAGPEAAKWVLKM